MRPEGWGNQTVDGVNSLKDLDPSEVALYESGADAMLEGLKKNGGVTLKLPLTEIPSIYKNGYLVFIPEEE